MNPGPDACSIGPEHRGAVECTLRKDECVSDDKYENQNVNAATTMVKSMYSMSTNYKERLGYERDPGDSPVPSNAQQRLMREHLQNLNGISGIS